MEIDNWFGNCKVRSFPWLGGTKIYFNVQCYACGQSINKPPIWDKTVYITNNLAGQKLVFGLTDSLVNYVKSMIILEGQEVVITA